MLCQEEKLAILIVAMLRNQLIKPLDCDKCENNNNGICGLSDSEETYFFHPLTGELTSCPINYIPVSVWDFFDRLYYYEKFPAAMVSYENVNTRFWTAVKEYDYCINTVLDYKKNNDPSKKTNNLELIKNRLSRR